MDTKYPELFRSRTGKVDRDARILNPCSSSKKRASRVFNDLSIVPLTSPAPTPFPPSTINETEAVSQFQARDFKKGKPSTACAPISTKSFYRTFNRFARDLYLERKLLEQDTRAAPVLFDLKGKLIEERVLRRYTNKKGQLFAAEAEINMPSSCKDIRTLSPPNPFLPPQSPHKS